MPFSFKLAKKPSSSSSISSSSIIVKKTVQCFRALRRVSGSHTSSKTVPSSIITTEVHDPASEALSIPLAHGSRTLRDRNIKQALKSSGDKLAFIPRLVHTLSTDTISSTSSAGSEATETERSQSDSSFASITTLDTVDDDMTASRPSIAKRAWSLESLRSIVLPQPSPPPSIRRVEVKKASLRVRFGAVIVHELPPRCSEETEDSELPRRRDAPCTIDIGPDTNRAWLTFVVYGLMISVIYEKIFAARYEPMRGYIMEEPPLIMPGYYDEEEWDQ